MRRKTIEAKTRKLLRDIVKLVNSGNVEGWYLWAILTILRGDDLEIRYLKNYSASRVRGFLGFDAGNFAVQDMELNSRERTERDNLLKKNSHFEWHYREAVKAIRQIYRYDLENEEKL